MIFIWNWMFRILFWLDSKGIITLHDSVRVKGASNETTDDRFMISKIWEVYENKDSDLFGELCFTADAKWRNDNVNLSLLSANVCYEIWM